MPNISSVLIDYLNHGREERHLEYKGDVSWDNEGKKLEIVKTILAMANFRDGGVIILGVNDDGEKIGLSEENYNSYTHDRLNQFLEGKTNQHIDCKVVPYIDEGSKKFVFIQIAESKEYPVIYTGGLKLRNNTKDRFPENIELRPFALYVRGKLEINSREIKSVDEWQEIIERTYKKYYREYLHRDGIIGGIGDINPYDKELTI